jgi:hypothetical protein
MQKSIVVSILRTCTKKECRELRKWVESPAHNQRQDVINLFGYLMEEGYLYNDEMLEKALVYKRVFPREEYDDAKMRQSIYFTTKCVEEFLIYQELRNDEIRAQNALNSVFRKRKLHKLFRKNMRATQKQQKNHDYRNGQYLRNKYLVEQEKYYFQSAIKRLELNLQEMSDTLDLTYISDKLRQSCLVLAHQAVYKGQEYNVGLLEEVLRVVKENNYLEYPAVAIYYYTYMTQVDRDEESHFYNLKKEMINNGHLFPRAEIRDIYLLALNYCIGRINAGEPHYLRESFEIYRNALEQGVLFDEGVLSRYTFINVVTIGTNLEEFDWIAYFIEEFQQYLEDKYRENIVSYSLGKLHFEKKEYDKAMRLFSTVEYDDILMNMNAKVMQIQMFYEQGEFEVIESFLESTRTYLLRKKVIGYHRSTYKNIIRLTKKLVKINPYSAAQKEKLKIEIENTSPLIEKEWLLEKIAEL